MRRQLAWGFLGTLLLGGLQPAVAQTTVCVIRIHEDISRNTLYLFRRGLNEAVSRHAAAVVLEMNTNGGRVDATEDIIRLLERAPLKTYTLVNQRAYSAGAYIAAATDQIFMEPGSVLGAATPIMVTPGAGVADLPKSYEEKLTSAMRALIRSTAQEKGHNPDVFEAMVDADAGLTVAGTVISPKGKLLTLTAEEAAREYGQPPRPLLSSGTVDSLAQLLAKVGLAGAETFEVQPYGFEVLARGITVIGPLLILIGFVAVYVELTHPGVMLPAIVAMICFGVYFLGYFAAGLAGKEELALFVIGAVLLAVEVFVIPGFGVTGVLGIGAILISLVMAMTHRWPGGPLLPAWPDLEMPLVKVSGAFGGSLVVMMILAHFFPKSSLFKKFELRATTSAAEGYTTAASTARSLLGAVGVAETQLRPSGKGRFGEELVDVVTEGDLIERGAAIKITAVEGSRVVVTRTG